MLCGFNAKVKNIAFDTSTNNTNARFSMKTIVVTSVLLLTYFDAFLFISRNVITDQ